MLVYRCGVLCFILTIPYRKIRRRDGVVFLCLRESAWKFILHRIIAEAWTGSLPVHALSLALVNLKRETDKQTEREESLQLESVLKYIMDEYVIYVIIFNLKMT